jgi:hypothetical protein
LLALAFPHLTHQSYALAYSATLTTIALYDSSLQRFEACA